MPENEPSKDDLDDTEAYLAALGNGFDIPGDRLGASQWRDDIDREPLDTIAEHALRGEHSASTGGTLSGLSEIAQQVQDQSDVQQIIGAIQHAEQLLRDKYEILGGLLADTAHLDGVARAADEVSEALGNAVSIAQAFGGACQTAAGAIRGGS